MPRGKFQTLQQALESMKSGARVVDDKSNDWRAGLPVGSRWRPGDPGRPNCQACKGVGYVTLDVGINHPSFGKLFVCQCVPSATAANLNENIARQFYK